MQKFHWVLPVLLFVAGCSPGIRVRTEFEPSVRFSERTYDWMGNSIDDIRDPRINPEVLDSRVKNAVGTELTRKGYRRVGTGAALVMRYHVALDDRLQVSEVNQAYSTMPEGYTMDALGKQVVKQMGGDPDKLAQKMAVGAALTDVISNDARKDSA